MSTVLDTAPISSPYAPERVEETIAEVQRKNALRTDKKTGPAFLRQEIKEAKARLEDAKSRGDEVSIQGLENSIEILELMLLAPTAKKVRNALMVGAMGLVTLIPVGYMAGALGWL